MTEDEEKVRKAVAQLLGGEFPEERQEAEGHFGNTIVWVRIHLTGDEAEAALRLIISRMDREDRKAVLGRPGRDGGRARRALHKAQQAGAADEGERGPRELGPREGEGEAPLIRDEARPRGVLRAALRGRRPIERPPAQEVPHAGQRGPHRRRGEEGADPPDREDIARPSPRRRSGSSAPS